MTRESRLRIISSHALGPDATSALLRRTSVASPVLEALHSLHAVVPVLLYCNRSYADAKEVMRQQQPQHAGLTVTRDDDTALNFASFR